jgi:hypothetical protein
VIVFSDGLQPVEDRQSDVDDEELAGAMDKLLEQPMNADMSQLEIHLMPTNTFDPDSKDKEAPPTRSILGDLKKKIMDRVPPKRKVEEKPL